MRSPFGTENTQRTLLQHSRLQTGNAPHLVFRHVVYICAVSPGLPVRQAILPVRSGNPASTTPTFFALDLNFLCCYYCARIVRGTSGRPPRRVIRLFRAAKDAPPIMFLVRLHFHTTFRHSVTSIASVEDVIYLSTLATKPTMRVVHYFVPH